MKTDTVYRVYDEWDDADFTKLRNSLGSNYAKKLRERVLKSNGEKYTERHIRKALTKEHAYEDIVLAAVKLAEKMAQLRKRAANKPFIQK